MKKYLSLFALSFVLLITSTNSLAEVGKAATQTVIIHTNKGPITLDLYPDKAPATVANFLEYANAGFYEGTIFHRVIKRFMIQGGGFTQDMQKKDTKTPVVNESGNGLHNDRYTIAMARTNDPDSATSQFFINTKANSRLDAQGNTPGYTVFGLVTDGQFVVKAIEKVPTHRLGPYNDVPVEPVIIERVEVK